MHQSKREGDTLLLENGLRIFPAWKRILPRVGISCRWETVETILELNQRLAAHKQPGHFLPFEKLLDLFREYDVLVGAAHPYRAGGHIPELPREQLERLDFLDLNGKDMAEDRERAERLTRSLGERLHKPVVSGSDTIRRCNTVVSGQNLQRTPSHWMNCAVKCRQEPIRLWFRNRPRFR